MDYIPVIAVMSEVQEDDPKSAEKALELSSYLDKTAKETESDDEVTFFEIEKKNPKIDLAKTTGKADSVVLEGDIQAMEGDMLSPKLEEVLENHPKSSEIPLEETEESKEDTKENPKAELADKADLVFEVEEPSEPEMKPVNSFEEEAAHGTLSTALKRSYDHVEISSLPEKKVRNDDAELQDEAGVDTPEESIKALEEKEPKLDLTREPEIKSDTDPFEVEEPSEPEMKPVNSSEEVAAHGRHPASLKRSYDHVEISSLPEKKVRNDDAELQDEAGDDTPEEPIKALEEKEPKLDLTREPEIKSDADPFGLEFSEEIVETMSRDDLERLLCIKVAEAKQVRAQLDKSQKTVALIGDKLAKVCKKLFEVKKNVNKENFGQQVGVPAKAWKSWNNFCNRWDIPSSPTFTHRRQEPNLASASYLIDLTDDVTDEDEEEVAAAEAAARSEKVAQVAKAVDRANAFLRQTANEAAKENVQPAAVSNASSGSREGVIFKRASRLPLAPLRRRP